MADTQTAPAGIRVFNMLAGLTTLAIFLQAISAGLFMSLREAGKPWVTVHAIVAYIAILLAVVTAIVAIVALRASAKSLMWGAIVLAVLLVVQVGMGQAIEQARGLVAVHVPLAFIVFALTIWLSVRGGIVRRRLTGTPTPA
ncbi:hypothetical protein GCM10009840_17200 [Pseudolysinimonas kribbensis]|uniref:Uncharacterized protein n=1 Tax=Pseudolysinimonas kribbensis TaxID=433641 RepID=A0ABQ6K1V3_9MICO|nr:hypothetical protein [Pseudolysinimonas kribbensis]GMA93907.1 hypothetical protein GCM10025881_07310 [Pseudolysinimonas kribbensis]